MSITEIKSAIETVKSFKSKNDAEFKLLYKYLKNAMNSILKNPVKIVKNNDKVSEVIIFEHYKVTADENNKLQLLIDFSAEPSNKFNAIDPIYVQRDTDLVEVSRNYDRGEVRHPRQNWLFDIQPSKEKHDAEYNHDEENDNSYKKNYSPYLTKEHSYNDNLNYKSLLFFIKTCAYFGVLEHLNNETIFMLAKHNSSIELKQKHIEADAFDESKKLVEFLLLVRKVVYGFQPDLLNDCFELERITEKTEQKIKLVLTTINKKISDSLLSIMHEKQVLIYLDNIYANSHLINYLIAVNNIEKYRTGLELLKNESENLANYILNFEYKLEGFNDKNYFSLNNKVTNWSSYHHDLTFPQEKSLQNFKEFAQGNIEVQKCLFEYIGMRLNSELIKGIKEKITTSIYQQEINNNLKNNWTYLMAWLTYGEEWQNCNENDIMCFGRIIEHCEIFELSKKLTNENESKNYSEEFAKVTDLLVRSSRKSDRELDKAVKKLKKDDFGDEEVGLAHSLIKKEEDLFDFVTGFRLNKKMEQISNLSLITKNTTEKNLINKSDKWHKDQILINKLKQLNIENPKNYAHLNKATIKLNGVTFTVLSNEKMVIQESIEMSHCLGTDYRSLINEERYIAVKGKLKNDQFTLGIVFRYIMGHPKKTPYFILHQCIGKENSPVTQEVVMKCKDFIEHINENPDIILKNKGS